VAIMATESPPVSGRRSLLLYIILSTHIPLLVRGKDPALPSSYRSISLLDTIGKVFEKILLARILREVSERPLMRDEHFGFKSRHSTSLQLARLVERITRNLGKKRLTGADFLDVAKAFYTVGSMDSFTS